MNFHEEQDSGPEKSAVEFTRYVSNHANPVFSGKPWLQTSDNLAIQHSLQEIFDEFTDMISGELKSLSEEEFNAENKQNPS